MVHLGNDWDDILTGEFDKEYYLKIREVLKTEYFSRTVFPPMNDIFNALKYTSFANTKVVILGQDPYHEPGQAQGLAFSVPEEVKLPPSLKNIFKEYVSDTGNPFPGSGDLTAWAQEGVLLMNAVLSVDQGAAASHAKKAGWEIFTDSVIRALSAQREQIAFILWGNFAISKKTLIDDNRHLILESVHPSPLSARRGFFGSSPFSKVSAYNGVNWLLQS